MHSNEQHLELVLAACQAKRVADMRNYLKLSLAAFSFGTGVAFVWLFLGAAMSILI